MGRPGSPEHSKFQVDSHKKGASRRMRPAQIMPMEKTYSWPLKSGVRIRNWSLTSLPLLLGMKVS